MTHRPRIPYVLAFGAIVAATLAACAPSSPGSPSRPSPGSASSTAAAASPEAIAGCPPFIEPTPGIAFDQALHDELLAMLKRDQAGRLGTGPDEDGDPARTERLREILGDHGWPGYSLVGEDGEDAAWAIAQHSDLDPAFQTCALAHLRLAVDAGEGSPGNLAYLEDRVAVAAGEPQRYGTQVQCTADGPEPATPLVDPDGVEALRKDAGLPPYADYLAEMSEICAESG